MYPETDVPPISITSERISRIKASLPPLPETVMKRLADSFGLNEKLAKQLLDSDFMELFETVATRTKIQPSFIATILTETLKSLERDGVALENLVPEHIEKIFYLVDKGETAKESVEKIARWIAENPGKTPDEAMEKLSLRMLSEQELASIVDKVVFDNISLLKDQGDRAAGKMLGLVMAQVRGRADAKRVAALVKERARSTT